MNENTRKKALLVQAIIAEHYEPERQDRCKLWVYRNHVRKAIPMSERTFWRYAGMKVEEEKKEPDRRQLRLFED